ncbi:MAG: STAS domain-containing protein [Nitriliruptorales bacterium]|nr:STAS domain-containing protein [Nitriliruptorales bacterium]
MSDFHAEVRRLDDVTVIAIAGDLDGDAGEPLRGAYQEATATDPDAVIIDFDELGFMNSSGIAHVVSLLGSARQADIDIRACGLSDHYRHVFEITRLADFMTIYDSEEAAASSPVGG